MNGFLLETRTGGTDGREAIDWSSSADGDGGDESTDDDEESAEDEDGKADTATAEDGADDGDVDDAAA